MVLSGDERLPNGRTVRIRVTLEATGGGVLQTVEISRDAGATWEAAIALAYAR